MQINWSVILNVLLLAGVFLAIFHMFRGKRKSLPERVQQPPLGTVPFEVRDNQGDDIVSIRQVNVKQEQSQQENTEPRVSSQAKQTEKHEDKAESIMIFLQAKPNQTLAGYELLQTILAAGLRFGEGHLFHRHQYPNGRGPVICSLAAATQTGVFDLQNIGAFNVRGLCLFMEGSGSPVIDQERLEIMVQTATQLSKDLDTNLLDENQQLLSDRGLKNYCNRLNIPFDNFSSSISLEKG